MIDRKRGLKGEIMERSFLYKKILIIEDDEVFMKPLVKFLTYNQFQVNIARNALTGLDLQDNIQFDLIITDLRMEGMSGSEAIMKISAKYPDAKIVVISGYLEEDEEFKRISDNPQVYAVYEKPVDYEELLDKIKEIL